MPWLRRCFLFHLSAHLLHPFAHSCYMTGRTAFNPGFIPLRSFLHVREVIFVGRPLPELRNSSLDAFPNTKKLAIGFKEQVLVEQIVIQQCASLLPVADHHHGEGAAFGSRSSDP